MAEDSEAQKAYRTRLNAMKNDLQQMREIGATERNAKAGRGYAAAYHVKGELTGVTTASKAGNDFETAAREVTEEERQQRAANVQAASAE